MATDILINAAKGKGRGYVIGSERWPRCEGWPAWAERFVQQRGYYRSDETKETPAEGGGSPHGGEQSQERRPSLSDHFQPWHQHHPETTADTRARHVGCRPAHRASSGSAQFHAFLRERLLLPVSEESADECDVRLQLNRKYSRNET